jgi:hypothetical protein
VGPVAHVPCRVSAGGHTSCVVRVVLNVHQQCDRRVNDAACVAISAAANFSLFAVI